MADNDKSSYSLPLLIVLPIKKLVKILQKIETNFLTGILIGAIFSLLVNILTNQIGEQITRQKSLEALEIEIQTHHQLDISMIDNVSKGAYKKSNAYYYNIWRYGDNIWKSLASTTFFYSLPPKTQGILISYYATIINGVNNSLANNAQIVNKYQNDYAICVFEGGDCINQRTKQNNVIDFYSLQQSSWGVFVDKYDYDIQKVFHPTRDRLNNPILNILMGKEALPILSLPWKETIPTSTPTPK